MKLLRIALWTFCAIVLAAIAAPVLAVLVQQQDQVGVTIVVNVSPGPLGMLQRAPQVHATPAEIAERMTLRAIGSAANVDAVARPLSAQILAQSAQQSVRVEAKVTPNPKATQLYTDNPVVIINGAAGSTVLVPCAFHVTADTSATTNWQLKEGVSNDFAAGFPGGNLANNTYITAPNPTSTPYIVFADNGGVWSLLSTGTGMKTYCVDLTVTIPVSIAPGAYSTNAVYTLFF